MTGEHRPMRREDLPTELHPLFDQLSFEIQRVGEAAHEMHRLRRLQRRLLWLNLGIGLAYIVMVAVFTWRALG